MNTLLANLKKYPGEKKHEENDSSVRYACVALIIRLRSSESANEHENRDKWTLDQFFQSHTFLHGEPEILYIQRAIHPHDRWSGHIAFPGGKSERGETREQTAQRETMEEIGVDLTQGFVCIGRLDERDVVVGSGKVLMVISPLVYLQTTPKTPLLTLQQVSKFILAEDRKARLKSLDQDKLGSSGSVVANMTRTIKDRLYVGMKAGLGLFLGRINYRGISLLKIISTANTHTPPSEKVLWGLTLGMTSDLIDYTYSEEATADLQAGLVSTSVLSLKEYLGCSMEHYDLNFFANLYANQSLSITGFFLFENPSSIRMKRKMARRPSVKLSQNLIQMTIVSTVLFRGIVGYYAAKYISKSACTMMKVA